MSPTIQTATAFALDDDANKVHESLRIYKQAKS